jgi:anti-sigma regulatory factor (Ser/Thr protein kinase)
MGGTGQSVREAIIRAIRFRPSSDLIEQVAKDLSVSRQAVHKQAKRLEDEGFIESSKIGRKSNYSVKVLFYDEVSFSLTGESSPEDRAWSQAIAPHLDHVDDEARKILQYAVTEMVNNAYEHSEGTELKITIETTINGVRIMVVDNGVGVFRKTALALKLDDMRESLVELSKGKFTTDPANHTGEGIFFTSRIMDVFGLRANGLSLMQLGERDGWTSAENSSDQAGTEVFLLLLLPAQKRLKDVTDKFVNDDHDFAKTHVPLTLIRFGKDQLISRSQAKRVLARIEKFEEVSLDFQNIETVGQAFADEIFRVFRNRNPKIRIVPLNANEAVIDAIARAQLAL